MFIRSQALRNPSRNPSKSTQEITGKDRISEILGDESWQSKIEFPEEILALTGSADDSRKPEPKQPLRLLESSDGATIKHGGKVSSSKAKERRKALLVEQPDQKPGGRSVPISRAAPSNHSRPMSADDIQKAKMRAMFMQDKYGKPGTSAIANTPQKTEEPKVIQKYPPHKIDTAVNLKRNMKKQSSEKLKKGRFQWRTPSEIAIDSSWRIGAGENSKEVQIQTQRNLREKETFYSSPRDIPPNPKEPWDTEMDSDDSLTPEIPIEQAPELDSPASAADVECVGSMTSPRDSDSQVGASDVAVPSPSATGNGQPEPDLELLAVLLKNPDVVFALTSGRGKSLTDEETVALLDLVKTTGVGLADIANGVANIHKETSPVTVSVPMPEPVQTSLPSPTPPPNATRVGWRSEFPSQLHPQSTLGSPTPAANPLAMNRQTLLSPPQMTVPANHHRTPQQQQQQQLVLPNLLPEIALRSNHRYPSNDPSFPMFPPPPQNPHSRILPGTMTSYQPNKIPAWPPFVHDSRTGRPNELLDGPMYLANNNNYTTSNTYPRGSDYLNGPEMGPRRELGRSQQSEWPRQGNPGHRDRYRTGGGGRRWRDRGCKF